MGSSLIKKVTPQQKSAQEKYTILDQQNRSDISRANFRFIQKLTVTGHNQQQIIWRAENIRNPNKTNRQTDVHLIDNQASLYDNNRITLALKELELWLSAYQENNIASLFFGSLLFSFQDYQFLYMVYEHIEGFTLDTVLKHHVFNQEDTKYVVAVMIQIMEFFHQKKYSLTQLSPEHLIVEKNTGQIKLLQIFNPLEIDEVYTYTSITNPSVYAAPQILARNKVLAESDFYTLGAMMYEMMTQKNAVLEELSHLEVIERHHIMSQVIELKKYNLPEGWNPEAADFLVKLLIKNPLYRLGRYGSFQLRFHPWLQNYNWQILSTRSGISLTQPFFKKPEVKQFANPPKINAKQDFQKILRNQLFLKLFEKYTFRRKLTPKVVLNQRSQQDVQQTSKKKSQKYYDEKHSESQNSSQSPQQEEFQDELEIESEQISKSNKQSQMVRGKPGRKLLNIIEKDF